MSANEVTRAEVIARARATVNALPAWRREELRREFDRAAEQARRILRGAPSQ